MSNTGAFNEFALAILEHLYSEFPIQVTLPVEAHVGNALALPAPPIPLAMGLAGITRGIRVGPGQPTAFGLKNVFAFDGPTQAEYIAWRDEGHLAAAELFNRESGASLDDEQTLQLLNEGIRPLLPNEEDLYASWKAELAEAKQAGADREKQRRVYVATAKFLFNEGLIRAVDTRHSRSPNFSETPNDYHFENNLNYLLFTLTADGFSRLNKPCFGGPLSGKRTVLQSIRSWASGKSSDAAASALAAAIVGAIFS